MKLTKAQENLLNYLKERVDRIRNCESKEEYFKLVTKNTKEEYKEKYGDSEEYFERIDKDYENGKQAIVTTTTDTRILKKLEENGLIKVLQYGEEGYYKYDLVKVLNY